MTTIAGSVRLPRFWLVAAATFAVAALYPLALALHCNIHDAARWIQNDVAFSVFVLWLFPLVTGLLWVSIWPGVRRQLSERARPVFSLMACVLAACSLVVVASDVVRVDQHDEPMIVEPALLRGADAMRADVLTRAPLRDSYARLLDQKFANDEAKNNAWIAWEARRATAAQSYGTRFRGFATITDLLHRGSAVALVKLVLNTVVAVNLALLFAALVGAMIILYGAPKERLNTEALLVAYSLACLWFPMRLYSEWYDGYYSLARLRSYPAFWVLAFIALLSLALLVYILKPGRLGLTIPSMAAAFGILFSGLGAMKPAVLWYLGSVIETFNLALLFVVAVILVMPFAAVAFAATNPVTDVPANPQPADG